VSVFIIFRRVARAGLAVVVLLVLSAGLPVVRSAEAAPLNATFAGWSTASGLFPDEASAEFTVPLTSPSGNGLLAWVGLGSGDDVFQAGAGVDASAGVDGCFWADYPATNSVPIAGLRCTPGDEVFVDIAQAYYSPTQSRVIVVDLTTGQSTGWMSVYTPDLAWNTEGQVMVESNTSLGPPPASFDPVTFAFPSFVRNGFVGTGGQVLPLNGLAFLGLVSEPTSLAGVVPGVSLAEDWALNIEAVEG
jgi:hypothetical protein